MINIYKIQKILKKPSERGIRTPDQEIMILLLWPLSYSAIILNHIIKPSITQVS